MKHFYPTLVVSLLLLFLGCEEPMNEPVLEDGSTQEPASLPTTTFFTETVTLDEIPEIADIINARAGKDMLTGKGANEEAVFDIEHIAKVIDTLNNTLYSFGFTLPDTPKTVVHNLVVGVDSIGGQYAPIILKYSSDEATYDSWAESGFDFGHFTGSVQQHAFSSYFDDGLFSKTDCEAQFDAVGDPIPCNEDVFSDGSAGGGSASGGSGSGSGSSGGCVYDNTFVPCGGSHQYTLHGSDSCGGNGDGSYWVLDVSCPNGGSTHILKGVNDACDDCESGPSGGAAINIDLAMAARISLLVDTLDLDIGLTQEQISFLNPPENWPLSELLTDFLRDNESSEEAINASHITLRAFQNDLLEAPFDESIMEEVYCCSPHLITSSTLGLNYYNYMEAQVAIIKSQYPEGHEFTGWDLTKIYFEANLDALQLGLDLIGLIPAFGEIADIANGVIYIIRDDGKNATLSMVSAIPIAGWFSTGTKLGYKVVNITSDISSRVTLKWIVKADGLIEFGRSSQLRRVLKITDSSFQAHHIIPWAKRNHPAVQKAAQSNSAFHMNEALNGIPLDTSIHLGSHPNYSNLIQQRLDEIDINQSPDEIYDDISAIISDVRNAIGNNPDTHINNLVF